MQLAIVDLEPERLDQMQRRTRRETKTADVAGVRRNLRLDQDDVEHFAAADSRFGSSIDRANFNLPATNFSSFTISAANLRMPSAVFSVAIALSLNKYRNFFSSSLEAFHVGALRLLRIELAFHWLGGRGQFLQQIRADREQVATRPVPESGPRCGSSRPSLPSCGRTSCSRCKSPAPTARPDLPRRCTPACSPLCTNRKSGRRTARSARSRPPRNAPPAGSENISVRLQLIPSFSRTSPALIPSQVEAILISTRCRSIPCSSYKLDQLASLVDRAFDIEREPRVGFRGDSAGHNLQNLAAKFDEQMIDHVLDLRRTRQA